MRRRATLLLILPALVVSPALPADARPDAGCDNAQHCYEAVLETGPAAAGASPDESRQAALERLRLLQTRHPGSIWAKRARLLQGLLLADQQPAEALPLFEAAGKDFPVLADYLRWWEAEALLRQGRAREAAALAEGLPESAPDSLLVNRADLLAGMAWHKIGDCRKAVNLLKQSAEREPQEPAVPAALLDAADCQLKSKDAKNGRATLAEIWTHYPHTPEAKQAETRLTRFKVFKWKPTPDHLYERANTLLAVASYEDAVATIETFLSTAPKKDSRRPAMRLKLGTALLRLQRHDEAVRVLRGLADESSAEAGEATVWLARVFRAQNDGKQLLALFLTLPTRSLSPEQRSAIQMLVASHHDDQSRDEDALAAYRHLAEAAASPSERAEALWRIGWIHYRMEHFREAVAAFESAMDDPQLAPQALYWTARALDRLQDVTAADHYLRLCRRYAFTYHCQLAKVRNQVSGLVAVPAAGEAPAAAAKDAPHVAHNVHYQRALELKRLGMDHEAAREMSWLAEHYAQDREALVELSALLGEAGAHHQALKLVKLHFRQSLEQGDQPVPRAVWEAAYPTSYLPTVRMHAGAIVDPYLVLAIIHEESQYDGQAMSGHGAIGLMQMMPATAQALAKQHGQPELRREDLFHHDTNIFLGVRYLEQLLRQFAGNVVHAVAAYNAGGPTVAGWVAQHGHREPDEFVELIPYQETRQYVKRVLHTYREYHRLGGNACQSGFLDKVC